MKVKVCKFTTDDTKTISFEVKNYKELIKWLKDNGHTGWIAIGYKERLFGEIYPSNNCSFKLWESGVKKISDEEVQKIRDFFSDIMVPQYLAPIGIEIEPVIIVESLD